MLAIFVNVFLASSTQSVFGSSAKNSCVTMVMRLKWITKHLKTSKSKKPRKNCRKKKRNVKCVCYFYDCISCFSNSVGVWL